MSGDPKRYKRYLERIRQGHKPAPPSWDPTNKRVYQLKTRFGLTLDQYAQMKAAQDSRCAICNELPVGGRGDGLCVDHNHVTGATRALLCRNCNTLLGNAKESPQILTRCIEYLQTHN